MARKRKKTVFKVPTHHAILLRIYLHKQPKLYERLKGVPKSELTQLLATMLMAHFNIDGAGETPREALRDQASPRHSPEPVDNLPRPKALTDVRESAPATSTAPPMPLETQEREPTAQEAKPAGPPPMSSAFAQSLLLQLGQYNNITAE